MLVAIAVAPLYLVGLLFSTESVLQLLWPIATVNIAHYCMCFETCTVPDVVSHKSTHGQQSFSMRSILRMLALGRLKLWTVQAARQDTLYASSLCSESRATLGITQANARYHEYVVAQGCVKMSSRRAVQQSCCSSFCYQYFALVLFQPWTLWSLRLWFCGFGFEHAAKFAPWPWLTETCIMGLQR